LNGDWSKKGKKIQSVDVEKQTEDEALICKLAEKL
jgi:hypothetical protein